MGVKQYALGKEHGEKGIPAMSHRKNGRRYDSASAQGSYDRGYSEGSANRRIAKDIVTSHATKKHDSAFVRMVTR